MLHIYLAFTNDKRKKYLSLDIETNKKVGKGENRMAFTHILSHTRSPGALIANFSTLQRSEKVIYNI